jgi:hypothetical protein
VEGDLGGLEPSLFLMVVLRILMLYLCSPFALQSHEQLHFSGSRHLELTFYYHFFNLYFIVHLN